MQSINLKIILIVFNLGFITSANANEPTFQWGLISASAHCGVTVPYSILDDDSELESPRESGSVNANADCRSWSDADIWGRATQSYSRTALGGRLNFDASAKSSAAPELGPNYTLNSYAGVGAEFFYRIDIGFRESPTNTSDRPVLVELKYSANLNADGYTRDLTCTSDCSKTTSFSFGISPYWLHYDIVSISEELGSPQNYSGTEYIEFDYEPSSYSSRIFSVGTSASAENQQLSRFEAQTPETTRAVGLSRIGGSVSVSFSVNHPDVECFYVRLPDDPPFTGCGFGPAAESVHDILDRMRIAQCGNVELAERAKMYTSPINPVLDELVERELIAKPVADTVDAVNLLSDLWIGLTERESLRTLAERVLFQADVGRNLLKAIASIQCAQFDRHGLTEQPDVQPPSPPVSGESYDPGIAASDGPENQPVDDAFSDLAKGIGSLARGGSVARRIIQQERDGVPPSEESEAELEQALSEADEQLAEAAESFDKAGGVLRARGVDLSIDQGAIALAVEQLKAGVFDEEYYLALASAMGISEEDARAVLDSYPDLEPPNIDPDLQGRDAFEVLAELARKLRPSASQVLPPISKPEVPEPIAPANSDTVTAGSTINISFAAVADASRYHVKLFDRAGKKTSYSNDRVLPSVCSGNTCTISVPGLPAQERAVWWVRAVNQAGWGAWSDPVYFDVEEAVTVPLSPKPLSPSSGSVVNAGGSLQLSFEAVTDASRYHVRVFDRVSKTWGYDNDRVSKDNCSGSTCTLSVSGLAVQDNAVWRVRAVNPTGWGAWSEAVSFDVKESLSVPAAPKPLSPFSGEVVNAGVALQLSFGAVSDATRYHVRVFDRVAKTWGYDNDRVSRDSCSGGTCTLSISGLAAQENVVWRVRAVNSAGWGDWSEALYFDVKEPISVPAAPKPLSPSNGSVVDAGGSLQLSFAPVSDASRYHVRVFDRVSKTWGYDNDRVSKDNCAGSTCTILVSGLAAQENAVWRVRAVNPAGWGAWSDQINFDVKAGAHAKVRTTQPLLAAGRNATCFSDDGDIACWGYGVSDDTPRPLKNPVDLTVGYKHACVLDDLGVMCWGNNDNGQLDVPSLSNPKALSADNESTCATDDTGIVCWGSNWSADIPYMENPEAIASVSGVGHRCALGDGDLKCWGGSNTWGQTDVPILQNPVAASLGTGHTCALHSLGVTCWGNNNNGQTVDQSLTNPRAIATGAHHTCALDDNGVTCWGADEFTEVPPLQNPSQITAGKDHSCALDDTGVVCWGLNTTRQLDVPEELRF